VNAGDAGVKVLKDGWTAITSDRSLSAHFEHTVAVTADGADVLSLSRGEKRAAEKGNHEGSSVSQAHLR
jgi:methionyl aminopeptidase